MGFEQGVQRHARRARMLAECLHDGQTDKSGRPYFRHLVETVAHYDRRYESLSTGDPTKQSLDLYYHGLTAAWLHDVVEDTPMTEEVLLQLEFPPEVVKLVGLLTRTKEVPNDFYYQRIKADPIARLIKAADMDSNTDPDRTKMLDEETRARLKAKYAKGYGEIDMPPRWWG